MMKDDGIKEQQRRKKRKIKEYVVIKGGRTEQRKGDDGTKRHRKIE